MRAGIGSFILIIGIALSLGAAPRDEYPPPLPSPGAPVDYRQIRSFEAKRQALEEKLARQQQGVLVTGRLRVEGCEVFPPVASQIAFLDDGVFLAIIPAGQTLRFVRHGCEELRLSIPPEQNGGRIDFGEIVLRQASPDRQRRLALTLRLPEEVAEGRIELTAGGVGTFRSRQGLFRSGGEYQEERGRSSVAVFSRRVRNGESVTFDGLSAVNYSLSFKARRCVQHSMNLENTPGDVDLGDIQLQKAARIRFRHCFPPGARWRETVLFVEERTTLELDSSGRSSSVILSPTFQGRGVNIQIPDPDCLWSDYGELPPDEPRDRLPEPQVIRQMNRRLEPGHLYRVQFGSSEKRECFIHVEELPWF